MHRSYTTIYYFKRLFKKAWIRPNGLFTSLLSIIYRSYITMCKSTISYHMFHYIWKSRRVD